MKRNWLVLTLLGILIACSTAWSGVDVAPTIKVDLPWKTFSEAVPDTQGSGFGACRTSETTEKAVFSARLVKGNDAYMFWYEFESGKIVWVVWIGNVDGSFPDAVGFGQVDLKTEGAHDRIPTLTWEKYDRAKHVTPCDFLVGPMKSGA